MRLKRGLAGLLGDSTAPSQGNLQVEGRQAKESLCLLHDQCMLGDAKARQGEASKVFTVPSMPHPMTELRGVLTRVPWHIGEVGVEKLVLSRGEKLVLSRGNPHVQGRRAESHVSLQSAHACALEWMDVHRHITAQQLLWPNGLSLT